MKDMLKSPVIKSTLWIVGVVLGILVIFGLGAFVGYRRALFSSRFGQNYYHNFYGVASGSNGMMSGSPMSLSMHGVAGEVIDVQTSSISVEDPSGNEQSVAIIPDTVIREGNVTIAIAEVETGEGVTVIGGPNAEGQIEARFIRVFPASSSMPMGQ